MRKGIFGILLAAAVLFVNIDHTVADAKIRNGGTNGRAEETVSTDQLPDRGQETEDMSIQKSPETGGSADRSSIRGGEDIFLKIIEEGYRKQTQIQTQTQIRTQIPAQTRIQTLHSLQSAYALSRILLRILVWLKNIIIWVILM